MLKFQRSKIMSPNEGPWVGFVLVDDLQERHFLSVQMRRRVEAKLKRMKERGRWEVEAYCK